MNKTQKNEKHSQDSSKNNMKKMKNGGMKKNEKRISQKLRQNP